MAQTEESLVVRLKCTEATLRAVSGPAPPTIPSTRHDMSPKFPKIRQKRLPILKWQDDPPEHRPMAKRQMLGVSSANSLGNSHPSSKASASKHLPEDKIQKALGGFKRERNDWESKMDMLQEIIRSKNARISEETEKRLSAEARVDSLLTQCEREQDTVADLRSANARLQEELDATRAAREDDMNQIRDEKRRAEKDRDSAREDVEKIKDTSRTLI